MAGKSKIICSMLKRAILAQRIAPGTKLGERALSEKFDASRIVIRQSLLRLSGDGLVTIKPNRGAFVAKPDMQEIMEMYDSLTLIEQGVAIQLASRLDSSGWQKLKAHIKLQKIAIDSGDNAMADDFGAGFHALFVGLTNNRLIQEIHTQVVQRTQLVRSLYQSRFDYCSLCDDHTKIVDLLEAGRLKPALALIEKHHHHVVRGYIMDVTTYPNMTFDEALAPFLSNENRKETLLANGN